MAVAVAAMEAAAETEEVEATVVTEADRAVVVHHQAEVLQLWIPNSAGA